MGNKWTATKMKVRQTLSAMRPHHYVKNVFVFLPLFFGLHFFNLHRLVDVSVGFVIFCWVASAVYIFNDLIDIHADQQHPTKRYRPIASGAMSKRWAYWAIASLLGAALILAAGLGQAVVLLVVGYIGINMVYSLRLKHVAIVDVFVIALGFFIRLQLGAVVAKTPLSMWIILMTFLLALFLGFAKRRDDILLLETGVSSDIRGSMGGYTLPFLDSTISILASGIIVAYLMYTVSDHTIAFVGSANLFYTTIFVLFGILRYLQITMVLRRSGSPTKILWNDGVLQATLVAWAVGVTWVLYL